MNIRAIRAKFPEYAKMSDAAFFTFMHKEYYPDMDRQGMARELMKLKEIPKPVPPTVTNKDKSELIKLGHTPQDIAKMPYEKATEIIEKKIEKPQEEIKAEKQAKTLEDIKTVSTKTLEEIKVLANKKPVKDPPILDTTIHDKVDTLIKEIATLKSKSPEEWEFEIVRDGRGNMEKVIARQI